MSPVPSISLSKLASLRARERLIRVVWGVTCWLAFAITLLTLAIITDWKVDQYDDTPMSLRMTLMMVQLIAFSVAALFLVVRPMIKGPSLIRLARRVERRIPEFDHRLVTSIQLTSPHAQIGGMSPQLIGMVTSEAEDISTKHNLTALADTRRFQWSLALLAWPLGVLTFLLLFFGPSLLGILLQRQILAAVEIPRDTHLTTTTKKNPWPAGDDVEVRYEVTSDAGDLTKTMKGTVSYTVPEKNKQGKCELVWDDKTEFSAEKATFKAMVPNAPAAFVYRARLGDGRTKEDQVTFEPRPQVTIEKVWVQAPAYVPNRPIVDQGGENITAFDGSRAQVRISVQKPISEATITLHRVDREGEALEPETRDMKILGPESGEDTSRLAQSDYFDLSMDSEQSRVVGYSVAVKDLNKFASSHNPGGTVKIKHPATPLVTLLPERAIQQRGEKFTEEQETKGMPVPLGGKIMVEYKCRSDVGICTPFRRKADNQLIQPAWLYYKINDGKWKMQQLIEVPETAETGAYDVENATFANLEHQKQKLDNQVPFHAKPATEAGAPARLEGGGFFDIHTATLTKTGDDGKEVPLELNDRIGFYIAIHDCDPAAARPPGTSDYREKTLLSPEDVRKHAIEAQKERLRIQEITKRQQEISKRPVEKP